MNKRKRLIWSQEQLSANEDFNDVIFTDESTVQLKSHARLCFRKRLQPRILKQRDKHPIKVHIWGGVSKRGTTNIVIFTGIMDAERLVKLYEAGLLYFLRDCYPDGHRLQQDNDSKHAGRRIEDFFEQHGVNWWATPPESPDLKPIENVWGFLKQFLRTTFKLKNLDELKDEIKQFWRTLTPEVCTKYINHLNKVIPQVVQKEGSSSMY